MAVPLRRDNSASSKWWSLSSKSSPASSSKQATTSKDAGNSGKLASGSKFNTLASVMGFKSRKHPSLTIQEPPYQTRSAGSAVPSPVTEFQPPPTYVTRPPSKSISSTRSPVESIEPVTPVDTHQPPSNRQSLFTLSDSDPFASHGIHIVPTSPDPNRLSVYSGSSGSDYLSKKYHSTMPNRTSYASSSFSTAGEQLSTTKAAEPLQPRKLSTRRSQGSLHRKVSLMSADSTLGSAWESLTSCAKLPSSSSSNAPDPHRRSQPPPNPLPRPPMRARGMTDVGMRQPSSKFLLNDPSSSSSASSFAAPSPSQRISPTLSTTAGIRRKQSSTRVGGPPPSAPPTHDLPLPPALTIAASADDDSDILPDISTSSTSSSSLSFASSVSSSRDAFFDDSRNPPIEQKSVPPLSFRDQENESKDKDITRPIVPPALQSPHSSPKTLKRALSHQSLGKRRTSSSSIASNPPPETTHDKVPRKQRSYPRIPVPPLPQSLRHATSFGPSSPASTAPTPTQRTSSAHGLPPSRNRLFSGPTLKRPSTSQCTPVDDDVRSVFSLPLEHERTQGLNFASNVASTASALHTSSLPRSSWTSNSIDEPSSPATSSATDYTPRRIKSPAELLKIEASVHESGLSYVRPRGLSFTSISTTMSEVDELPTSAPHSPPTSLHLLPTLPPHTGSPLRSASSVNRVPPVPRLQVRPSTSQTTISPPASPTSPSSGPGQVFFPVSSSQTITTSLPPPPRPRPSRPSTAPLSPALETPTPTSTTYSIIPLAPPTRKRNVLPKISAEKILQRRSLMRKPSFLEIEDDVDKDDDGNVNESFLDLARESFDTVRTIDE